VRRDVVGLALALALGIAACVVAAGCGSVDTVHQVADAGVDVEQRDAGAADSMLSSELAPDRAAADAAAEAAAEVGPSCSWECRAFCDCGALPCCRATGAADCCTR